MTYFDQLVNVNVKNRIHDHLDNQFWCKVWNQVRGQNLDRVHKEVSGHVWDQVCAQISEQIQFQEEIEYETF